ncbi:MAG TPA: acetate/propionate family kinase [Stellaceae bacterium]|nr:acetate/propionate family kinase [Stellaceae bacterium]
MTDVVLVVNAGSSSLKFSVYEPSADGEPTLLLKGQMEGIGVHPHLSARDSAGKTLIDKSFERSEIGGHDEAIAAISEWLRSQAGDFRLLAVGHRVVHGGPDFSTPVLIDAGILEKLDELSPLAPLHQPASLAGIRAVAARQPSLPQVACFDTAFHRGHSELAERFAVPEAFYHEGVRRYGFHGLSYEFIARRLPAVASEIARGKVVVAHLGSGASMCAIVNGKSVDSTMGFTALDGLPMGTRCGALDPGVVIHLMRAKGLSPDAVEKMLYNDCGLRGLSGVSNDMRDLLKSEEPRAKLAVDYFVHHVVRQLGALSAVMEGLDGIVFTAGIGERSPEIRARVCEHSAWLGVRLDPKANAAGGPRISAPGSRVSAWVVPTDEELMIAIHTLELVKH